MEPRYPIHDLFVRPLKEEATPSGLRTRLLAFEDHLLRRFGSTTLVRIRSGQDYTPRVRRVADEVWVLLEGEVEFAWHDLRDNSPTYQQRFALRCAEPTLALVPFGVSFVPRCLSSEALLLSFATHAEDEGNDLRLLDAN